jgi:hypothetical protein
MFTLDGTIFGQLFNPSSGPRDPLAARWRKEGAVWLFRKKSVSKTEFGAFANFVPEQGLRHIEEGSAKSPSPRKEDVRYIVLQVRDDTPEDLQRHLDQALEIVVNQGGIVESIMSSIVSVIFKPTPDPQDRPVDALLARLGLNVRAVYGHGECLRGFLGIPAAFSHGTILPNFNRTLEILLHLEFGSSAEICHPQSS